MLTERIQHPLRGADGGHGADDILLGVLGRRAANRLDCRNSNGFDIAISGDIHPTLERHVDISDGIAEDIIGNDHVESLGILGYLHADGVNMNVFTLDVGTGSGDDFESLKLLDYDFRSDAAPGNYDNLIQASYCSLKA